MRKRMIACLALAALLLSCALPAAADPVLSFPYEFGGIGFELPEYYKKESQRKDGNVGFTRKGGTTAEIVFEVYESELSEADFEIAAQETVEKGISTMTKSNAADVAGGTTTIAGHPAITLSYRTGEGCYRVFRTVNDASGSGLTIWFVETASAPSDEFEEDVERIITGAYARDGGGTTLVGVTPQPTQPPKQANPSIRYGNVMGVTYRNLSLEISRCFGDFSDRIEKDGSVYFCAERNTSGSADLPGDAFLQLSSTAWSGDPNNFSTEWPNVARVFLEPYGATPLWLHTTMNRGGMAIEQFFIEKPTDDSLGFDIEGVLFYNYAAQRVVCALIYQSDRSRYDYGDTLIPMVDSAALDNKNLTVDESQVDPTLKKTMEGYIEVCQCMLEAFRQARSSGDYSDEYYSLVNQYEQVKAKLYGTDWAGLSPADRAYVDKAKQIIDETGELITNTMADDAVSAVMDSLEDLIISELGF